MYVVIVFLSQTFNMTFLDLDLCLNYIFRKVFSNPNFCAIEMNSYMITFVAIYMES